ncbi:MAG: mechanosensitive ion channel [Solobacterium sp.]|nr:mechanosensitive ion channel [Solobacterium sp.]
MTVESVLEIGANIFENGLLMFLLNSLLTIIIARILAAMFRRASEKMMERTKKANATSLIYINRIITFLISAVAAYNIVRDIKPLAGLGTALLGTASIITAVLGIAAQETFGNFMAGFSIAVTEPFRVGDLIVIQDHNITGYVTEITFRHTIVTTYAGTRIIVPNSVLNTAIVEDKVFGNRNFYTFDTVTVAYGTDLEKAKEIIRNAVMSHPLYVDERTPEDIAAKKPGAVVRTDAFGESGVVLKYIVASKVPVSSFSHCAEIRDSIYKMFSENGIVIPYQTVTVIQQEDSH